MILMIEAIALQLQIVFIKLTHVTHVLVSSTHGTFQYPVFKFMAINLSVKPENLKHQSALDIWHNSVFWLFLLAVNMQNDSN